MEAVEKRNLMDLGKPGLEQFFADMGEKPFRASQILKWIYHQGVIDFSLMTNLSKTLRDKLVATAVIQPPEILKEDISSDGTYKWVIRVAGGNAVETVYIPEKNRGTICISSQVGCALNCTFCSTATQGFNRNLTTAEIIGQVWLAAKQLGQWSGEDKRITNVVLMGMGEPLMNFDSVLEAVSLMREDLAFGYAGRRITLSTAGLIPGIEKLREISDISLAVSLHAANDELRNKLVPLNRKYPIKQLLQACRRYVADKARAKITFEYTLIDGMNDSAENAYELSRLLKNFPAKVNLIPFNPFPGTHFQRSKEDAIIGFKNILMSAGLIATVRRPRGDDIDAACGQLVGRVLDKTRRQQRHKLIINRASA